MRPKHVHIDKKPASPPNDLVIGKTFLVTEGDTVFEALANVQDTFAAAVEIYQDRRRPLSAGIHVDDGDGPVSAEAVVAVT